MRWINAQPWATSEVYLIHLTVALLIVFLSFLGILLSSSILFGYSDTDAKNYWERDTMQCNSTRTLHIEMHFLIILFNYI